MKGQVHIIQDERITALFVLYHKMKIKLLYTSTASCINLRRRTVHYFPVMYTPLL